MSFYKSSTTKSDNNPQQLAKKINQIDISVQKRRDVNTIPLSVKKENTKRSLLFYRKGPLGTKIQRYVLQSSIVTAQHYISAFHFFTTSFCAMANSNLLPKPLNLLAISELLTVEEVDTNDEDEV